MSPFPRLGYRFRQFRLAFWGPRKPLPDEALLPHLTPQLIKLFRRMSSSEQAHSYSILERLQGGGQADPDLLAAALLHDVGKARSPLSAFDRVLIVLGKKLFPGASTRWGQGAPRGLHRPFVVATCHPAWGAEMAREAGASPRSCDLIRRHQEVSAGDDLLLLALQWADDYE